MPFLSELSPENIRRIEAERRLEADRARVISLARRLRRAACP